MISSRGSVRGIDHYKVQEKEKEGWKLLPSQQINEKGLPKQEYYIQYDEKEVGKITKLTSDPNDLDHPILEIEII